jgi:hypothetical protein
VSLVARVAVHRRVEIRVSAGTSSALSTGGDTVASVLTKASIVAMSGASIPEPLQMPEMRDFGIADAGGRDRWKRYRWS